MRVFLTGAAGFIGFHLAARLLSDGHEVYGYDGMTPYYDVSLKERRLALLNGTEGFHFQQAMLEDRGALESAVIDAAPEVIIHLAAQAGVRYSLEAPEAYVSSNVVGTLNLMEVAKVAKPGHLLIASTSSVYGGNPDFPFAEATRTDFPVSLYAATKKATEAISHSYAHLWKIPVTCFRFFTVYGTWGRPDMALFKFVSAIARGEAIDVYGGGQMKRDSTYVGDLVEGIVRLMSVIPQEGQPCRAAGVVDSLSPVAPWRVVNIGGGQPLGLLELIEGIELGLGRTAQKNVLPMQKGDVRATHADPALLAALTGYVPSTPASEWIPEFVAWHQDEYGKPQDA